MAQRQVACHYDCRSELAEGPREGEQAAGDQASSNGGEDNGPKYLRIVGSQCPCGLLLAPVNQLYRRAYLSHHERKRHENVGDKEAREGDHDLGTLPLEHPSDHPQGTV